jgi:hypothetical protein
MLTSVLVITKALFSVNLMILLEPVAGAAQTMKPENAKAMEVEAQRDQEAVMGE